LIQFSKAIIFAITPPLRRYYLLAFIIDFSLFTLSPIRQYFDYFQTPAAEFSIHAASSFSPMAAADTAIVFSASFSAATDIEYYAFH
jgi:hypothetical protein